MKKIGVLRGGPNDFEISLRTGQSVLDNLEGEYETIDIFVDRNGFWFINGLEVRPEKVSNRVDLIFNCVHGMYGEDGKVQRVLDSLYIPYTGSGPAQSAIAINKHLSKRNFLVNGFNVPRHEVLSVRHDLKNVLRDIYQKWSIPLVVKPLGGSNLSGVSIVNNFADLEIALANAFEYSNEIIVEEFLRGRTASCCVLENFRNKSHYTFLPIEISTLKDGFEEYITPGRFSREEKERIQELAIKAHQSLGLKHYSKSDFIIGPKNTYILGTSTSPDLHEDSVFGKSLEAIGSNLKEFTKHVVNLALS